MHFPGQPGSEWLATFLRAASLDGGYERAWNSNDPAEIGALFADDARYLTAPFDEPRAGREAIVAGWLEDRDEPGDFAFEWQPLLETPELTVVTGTTAYVAPPRATATSG